MIGKILIANRGEIACRVMRTARRLGVRAAAVYTDADRSALHVRRADEALRIPSYLDVDAILAAAREAGAEAIHPGYGFLAENARFAARCAEAGIVFIGPSPQAIAAMGDKAAAKRLMEKAGVPLLPGYHGENQDAAFLEQEAARIGFPVLIKPAAGGGGKGMRVVRDRGSFAENLAGARREARSSFADDRVLVERYLERPRHIEMQVFGDSRGNVVHLFERDCSVQRRHQKVLEEAPAPGFDPRARSEMAAAALAAAKAIGYTGAGTVEFIAESETDRAGAPGGRFYFMEMNTRLQVEHPVTEMVTGIDLVEWQLLVAAGREIPLQQAAIEVSGHAIEARIYAEDPQRGFLPSTGRLLRLAFPAETRELRIDAGVEQGDVLTPWYDPMIAKLVVRGAERGEALARLRAALAEVEIAGLATNVELLRAIAGHRAFAAAELDTGLIERHRAELLPPRASASAAFLATAAFAELAHEEAQARGRAAASGDPWSPWHGVDGWQLNAGAHHDFVFLEGETERAVRVRFLGAGLALVLDGREHVLAGERQPGGVLSLRLDGRTFAAHASREGRDWHLYCEGAYRRLSLKPEAAAEDAGAAGTLTAPMPGRIVKVMAKKGARVEKGAPLVILEAMKMEHTIAAPADGTVKAVHYGAGDQVLEGAELVTLE